MMRVIENERRCGGLVDFLLNKNNKYNKIKNKNNNNNNTVGLT